jgi:adenine-specific DNA-methyltransferase
VNVPKQLSLGEGFMALTQVEADRVADYGEVFTRRWIVELILDLVGYTSDRDLASLTLVEPSCGTGAFLVPIIDRLIQASERYGRDLRTLGSALCAFDLVDENAERARKLVGHRLQEAGLGGRDADLLADRWVTTGDFLLTDHVPTSADFVVGNPPYIRLESVPRSVMQAYRTACPTMRGRSDIYVGFIERGLELLKSDGVLGFICADRWMRNQYGADLRELITNSYAVETVIAMHDVDAFEDDVSAYPAIVVLRNAKQASVAVVDATGSFDKTAAKQVAGWIRAPRRRTITGRSFEASRLDRWFDGRDLWPSGSASQLALVAHLEARFPPLEDARTATRVGIGVATGCDDVYITRDTSIVEEDRLLPLLQAGDITTGFPEWQGTHLVNPWNAEGLVDLKRYRKLKRYLESHADRLRERHVAKHRPGQWYRTIDRVDPKLLGRAKLVLPDLKASAHPVLDEGRYYPHHNLYFVVSDVWDLEVLGGLLLSDVANLFVGAYCVKMRGGCYRFQAQYVRRIRVPVAESLSKRDKRSLAAAFSKRDVEAATFIASRLYGLEDVPRRT